MFIVLGCERSEPGFESRRPESDFTSTHQKTEEKSAVNRQPLATISQDKAQLLLLSHTSNIYISRIHGHLTIIHSTSCGWGGYISNLVGVIKEIIIKRKVKLCLFSHDLMHSNCIFFFTSYQLLGKILEHNVYKINISLDALYLM